MCGVFHSSTSEVDACRKAADEIMATDNYHANIREGDDVIIDLNGEKFSFVKIKEGGTVMVAGAACSMAALLGAPFGSSFLVNRERQLERTNINPHDQLAVATTTEKVCSLSRVEDACRNTALQQTADQRNQAGARAGTRERSVTPRRAIIDNTPSTCVSG
jgi:hypothetical protein